MRIVGVHCSGGTAYFGLLDNDQLIEAPPVRLHLPAGESSERLHTFTQDLARSLRDAQVEGVALLRAEGQAPGRPVNAAGLARRTVIETLVRLAGVDAGLPVHVIERVTVRARLGLERTGRLDALVDAALPGMHGRYWAEGRGLAALAARAIMSP